MLVGLIQSIEDVNRTKVQKKEFFLPDYLELGLFLPSDTKLYHWPQGCGPDQTMSISLENPNTTCFFIRNSGLTLIWQDLSANEIK